MLNCNAHRGLNMTQNSDATEATKTVQDHLKTDPAAKPRRQFLQQLGTLAAAGSATAFSAGAAQGETWPTLEKPKSVAGVARIRSVAARSVRVEAAKAQFEVFSQASRANSDEQTLDGFISCFSKTLPHNALGEVDPAAYRSLLVALGGNSDSAWEQIPLSPAAERKLANPQASLAFSMAGGDSHAFFMPPAPAFSSSEAGAEMAELYLHALLRDLPFDQYPESDQAQSAADQLNTFPAYSGPREAGLITPRNLFRGAFSGDLSGNYVSQFLLMPVPQGAALTQQRYQTTVPGDDHMVNQNDWLNVLRGGAPFTGSAFESTPRYITSARDLGEFVHRDYSFQTYLQAALILLDSGVPNNSGNPYNASANQEGFVTFGAADILAQVAEVSRLALKAAWFQKWQVHRRLRPEVFGGRIHFTLSGQRDYPINSQLLNSPVLETVADSFGGQYWLPMAYPEGSPTHPAYPAGHGVIAGACVTVLKAFFDGSAELTNPVQVVPGSGGSALQPYSGTQRLTVEGELNKLANNIAIGRNLAGVHWRTDGTNGLLLGEQVALRMLRDEKLTFTEDFGELTFTGFNGEPLTI